MVGWLSSVSSSRDSRVQVVAEVAGRLGFHAFSHPALGDIPSKHSEQ